MVNAIIMTKITAHLIKSMGRMIHELKRRKYLKSLLKRTLKCQLNYEVRLSVLNLQYGTTKMLGEKRKRKRLSDIPVRTAQWRYTDMNSWTVADIYMETERF